MDKKSKTIISVIIALILVTVLICVIFFSIDNDDLIKIQSDEGEQYIVYNDSVYYYWYMLPSTGSSPEINPTRFCIYPEIKGEEIGYCRNAYNKKGKVILLDGTNENIIITYQLGLNVWLKDGCNIPDLYEAEIDSIEYRKPKEDETKRTNLWSAKENNLTLNQILDYEKCFALNKALESKSTVYFRLADYNYVEIPLGTYFKDSELYIRFIENFIYTYYPIREEYKELFLQILEE